MALTRENFATEEQWLEYLRQRENPGALPNRPRRSDFDSADEWKDYRNEVKAGMNTNPFDLDKMYAQQNQNAQFLKDAGAFGGLRQSDRNPGGALNSGIDYLKANYNRAANPYENGLSEGLAQAAVRQAQQIQKADAEYQEMLKQRTGTVSTADGKTQYFSDPSNARPDFVSQIIPDRYGGGVGIGNKAPIMDEGDLPTGSGIPMSPQEAYGIDQIGNGIYAPEDRTNATSMDANDARHAGTAQGVRNAITDFYQNRQRTVPEVPESAAAEVLGNDQTEQIRESVSQEVLQTMAKGEDPTQLLDRAVSAGVMTPEEADVFERAYLSKEPVRPPAKPAPLPPLQPDKSPTMRDLRNENKLMPDWMKSALNEADDFINGGLKQGAMNLIGGLRPRGSFWNPFD